MTMVNAVIQNGQAYLFADSAIVAPATGRVVAFEPKLRVSQHFPCAVGVTVVGSMEATSELQFDAPDLDWLLGRLSGAMQAFRDKSAELGLPNAAVRLVVAAWDARWQRPRVFVAGDGNPLEPSPWCPPGVAEVEYFFGADEPAASEIAELWQGSTPCDPERFHLHRDGIGAFEISRRSSFTPIGGGMGAGCYVGGEIHLAIIGPDGVSAAPIHSWPDAIGWPIKVATVQ